VGSEFNGNDIGVEIKSKRERLALLVAIPGTSMCAAVGC